MDIQLMKVASQGTMPKEPEAGNTTTQLLLWLTEFKTGKRIFSKETM